MLRHALIGGAAGVAVGLLAWAIYRATSAKQAASSTSPPGQQPIVPVDPGLPIEPPTPRACPSSARVLLIGDSLVGDAPSNGLQKRMAELATACGTPFHARGVVGSHVTQWASDSWLLPELEQSTPTVVLISMGTNDFQRTDPANVQAGVTKLASKVRAYGARLLWICPPVMPLADKIGVRDMWKAEVGTDWYPSELLTIPRAGDGIHPTPAGYKQFAEAIWPWAATMVG